MRAVPVFTPTNRKDLCFPTQTWNWQLHAFIQFNPHGFFFFSLNVNSCWQDIIKFYTTTNSPYYLTPSWYIEVFQDVTYAQNDAISYHPNQDTFETKSKELGMDWKATDQDLDCPKQREKYLYFSYIFHSYLNFNPTSPNTRGIECLHIHLPFVFPAL